MAGIYAGTIKKPGEWKTKSPVTDEALRATAEYMMGKIEKGHEAYEITWTNMIRIMSKVEREAEKRLKAMMWFHQDYNPKHYSFTVHPSNIICGENGSRFEVKRKLEYHPPKRNGHRRNHAPSELYKDFFDKMAQEDIEKNSPVQTPFGEEYGLMKQLGLK